MAFFNEAFYSTHTEPESASSPLQTKQPTRFDVDIDQTLDEAVDFLSSSDVDKLLSSSPRGATPKIQKLFDTPPSSIANLQSSSPTKRKRVDFAPFTSVSLGWAANAGPLAQKENSSSAFLRKLQPSRERSTLRSKSILKATQNGGNERSGNPEMASTVKTWPQVLEFGLKQLSSDKPGIRLDAWRSMQQFLATTPDISAIESLGEKHSILLPHAIRDIQYTEKEQNNGLPNQLPNHAAKFMSKLVRLPVELPANGLASLLEIMILQMQTRALSKNLVKCYLEFFYQQQCGPEIMTPSRLRRIVEAIHALELHQVSTGTLLDEMKVFRKFVDQCPEGMIASSGSWLEIFLRGAQSDDENIFTFSVDTLFEIAVKLGHRVEVSKALQKALSAKVGGSNRSALQILEEDMAGKADFANNVNQAMLIPKLVSALLLLTRGKGPAAVFNGQFRSLVSVIQPYFMKTKSAIISHAYTTWSWLIISLLHAGRWPEDQIAFLRRPLEKILTKQPELDLTKPTPSYALSTYLVLLYSSFTPDAPPNELKKRWDEYVVAMLEPMILSKSNTHTSLAARIFTSLLSSQIAFNADSLLQSRKPWQSVILKVGDIPRIDSMWVRANLDAILPLLDRLLKSPHRADHAVEVFGALLNALSHARSNEIVATKEAKAAVAKVTNYLAHLWKPYSRKAKDILLFGQLLELLVGDGQGSNTIFLEQILRQSPEGTRVEVVSTPSHRIGSNQSPTTAVAYFLTLLTQELVEQYPRNQLSQEQDEPSVLFEIIKTLTVRVCLSESTLPARLTSLYTLMRKLLNMKLNSAATSGQAYVNELCREGLGLAVQLLEAPETGKESIDRAQMLLIGLTVDIACNCSGVSLQVNNCYRQLIERACQSLGAAGALVGITETAARQIHHELKKEGSSMRDDTLVEFASTILETTATGIPSADVRRAFQRHGQRRVGPVRKDDLVAVYNMTNLVFLQAYEGLSNKKVSYNSVASLSNALAELLRKQEASSAHEKLILMQHGIATIMLDKRRVIFEGPDIDVHDSPVHDLWQAALSRGLFDEGDPARLTKFDALIAAGLSSRCSEIINDSVKAWNITFGKRADLEYPPLVAKALRKLQALDVEIELVSPIPPPDESTPDSPLIIESTNRAVEMQDVTKVPTPKVTKIIPRLSASPLPSASRRRRLSTTPGKKPKPKHEDSQVYFEPIASSPLRRPDTQLLTEHQLEVWERQREGSAALFAGASAPITASAKLAHLTPNVTAHAEQEVPVATPSTPVLHALLDDAIPSSSPVVASVRRRQNSIRPSGLSPVKPDQNDEVPSSPPAGPVEEDLGIQSLQPLTLDREDTVGRKGAARQSQLVHANDASSLALETTHGGVEYEAIPSRPAENYIVPSTAPEDNEASGGTFKTPLPIATSIDEHVGDSFAVPTVEVHVHEGPISVTDGDQLPDELQNGLQESQQSFNESQSSESQRKKRRRSRGALTSAKKRKTHDMHEYNTAEFIKFTPKLRFTTPEDMLPIILCADDEEGENGAYKYAEAGLSDDIQIPATVVKKSRGRPRKSLEGGQTQESQLSTTSHKRNRKQLQEAENDQPPSQRVRIQPKTPRRESSVSSIHFVEVTPGTTKDRDIQASMRTDTPEVEEFVSMPQQQPGEQVDETIITSTFEPPTKLDVIEQDSPAHDATVDLESPVSSQLDAALTENQIEGTQALEGADAPSEDHEDFFNAREDSPAESIPASQASSQSSQSSQISNFSVSAFKDVMSRFVDQIKDYVNGGNRRDAEAAARRMEEEANKTVERLARLAGRRKGSRSLV